MLVLLERRRGTAAGAGDGAVFDALAVAAAAAAASAACSNCWAASGASLSAMYVIFTGSPSFANNEYEPSMKCLPSFLYPRTLAVSPFSKSILKVGDKFRQSSAIKGLHTLARI